MVDWAGFWTAAIGGLTGGVTVVVIFAVICWNQERQQKKRWQTEELEREVIRAKAIYEARKVSAGE